MTVLTSALAAGMKIKQFGKEYIVLTVKPCGVNFTVMVWDIETEKVYPLLFGAFDEHEKVAELYNVGTHYILRLS